MNHQLREYDINVEVFDPWANPAKVQHEYGIKSIAKYPEGPALSLRCPECEVSERVVPEQRSVSKDSESKEAVEGSKGAYGAIILAVAHNQFMSIDLLKHKEQGCIIYDVKGIIDPAVVDGRL